MLVTMTTQERALLHCLAVAAHVRYPFREKAVNRIARLLEQHVQNSQASVEFAMSYVGYTQCTNRYADGGALFSINSFDRASVNPVPIAEPIDSTVKTIDRRLEYQMRKASRAIDNFKISEVQHVA